MFSKEEKHAINKEFWEGFKTYCHKNKIKNKWLLSKISIKSTQLKFYIDNKKALVLFQIDNKSEAKRHEIYSYFYAMKKLWDKQSGEDLKWNKDFDGIQDINISAVYFEIKGVSIYNQKDYEQIYDFFVKKMTILEDIYFEYKEVLSYQISQLS